ncbi:hypothetical protein CHU95_18590 [Niveispirillum lacus]|uniref:SnoaL-like domain-containing protein n=1 Tax=Niveispirillum lacus TaxID=1981099 RepID=A0A255YU77_9PROT|nr:nuclear transport factor 2 family protein [Niveispirillum lacus]OYQ32762.1 hypothetical protein CHU95_18590 [Niveispirillum lacus]
MRLTTATLLASLVLVIPAHADDAAINRIYGDMRAAYTTLDLSVMERIYTPDVSYLQVGPGEAQWQAGRADVLGGFRQMFDAARTNGDALDIRFRIVQRTMQGDDAAADIGHFKLTVTPKGKPAQVMAGTFITMPVKTANGTWAFAADSWGPVKVDAFDKAVKSQGLRFDD